MSRLTEPTARFTPEAFHALLERAMPTAHAMGIEAVAIGNGTATLRLPAAASLVRPGGTLAGPTMFGLADLALYAAVLGAVGPAENAVTTSMNINFLRRPRLETVIAEAKLLKLGKRLAIGEVTLFTEGDPHPIAHATGTYSIPPEETTFD